MTSTPTLLALAIAAGLAFPLHAEQAPADATTFDPVEVKAARDKRASSNQNVTTLDTAQLQQEQAESMEDLVRYIPGVSIADMGRFGENGFNIRGLEGDRVAMTIDGLSMAEGVETARDYEFFRAGRGGVDVDSLKRVDIVKGADSISAGSGALGGAVVFTTKDPYDYLKAQGNDSYVGLKTGYTGHNDQLLGNLTVANRSGIVESMLTYTRREGHESEGWYSSTDIDTGSARRTPDPVDSQSDNVLAKLDVVPNAQHRIGVVYERNRSQNRVDNLSRVSAPSYAERIGEDSNDRDRYGLRYIWNADNTLFDTMEAQLDRQQTDSRGTTRILTQSGSSSTPATAATTRCTVALPCRRAEDRDTEQTLTASRSTSTSGCREAGGRKRCCTGRPGSAAASISARSTTAGTTPARWTPPPSTRRRCPRPMPTHGACTCATASACSTTACSSPWVRATTTTATRRRCRPPSSTSPARCAR